MLVAADAVLVGTGVVLVWCWFGVDDVLVNTGVDRVVPVSVGWCWFGAGLVAVVLM